MNKRMRDLCMKAADYLDGGGDPFEHGFLSENSVTLDEAMDMAEIFAEAMRLVLGVTAKPHNRDCASNGTNNERTEK